MDTVPAQAPNQGQIVFPDKLTPYALSWWNAQYIDNIPAESVGWLVSQGWQINSVAYDTSTTPQIPRFTMTRESMQNWQILQSLLNEWTTAYNDAKWANSLRYNQVIENWSQMIATSQTQFGAMSDEQNAHSGLYLGNLEVYMSQIEALIDQNAAAIDQAVAAIVPILDSVTSTGATYATDFEAILDLLPTDYSTHATTIDAILDVLPTEYATYAAKLAAVLDLLTADYDLHVPTVTAFLDNLGATEAARINERFDASLSKQMQQLTDRGMYSSGLAIEITERNTRDRNEELVALADRINREKWENQHRLYEQQAVMRRGVIEGKGRLYEQQAAMRGRTLDGRNRLYEQQVAMRAGSMEGETRLHAVRQEILRYRIAQTMGNAEAVVSHRHKAITELMSISVARLEGTQAQHAKNLELMAYQLDERNKLLVGIYGFVERREDVGPRFEQLAQVCTSLGDAGGGWLTP